jgi:hypothetical protein
MNSDDPRSSSGDLAAQATAKVEECVSTLNERVVKPVLASVAYVVIALAGLLILLGVAVLLVVALERLLNRDVFAGRVYATDFLLGGMCCTGGLFLLRRSVRARSDDRG